MRIPSERLCFTYAEAGRAVNVCEATIRKLVRSGELEVLHVGRCRRIPRHALLRLCHAEPEGQPEPNTPEWP